VRASIGPRRCEKIRRLPAKGTEGKEEYVDRGSRPRTYVRNIAVRGGQSQKKAFRKEVAESEKRKARKAGKVPRPTALPLDSTCVGERRHQKKRIPAPAQE